MVVRRTLPSSNVILRGNEMNDMSQSIEVSSYSDSYPAVPWRGTFSMRPIILSTIANGRPSSRFTNSPLNKMRCRLYSGAPKSLDLLRLTLQSAINQEIDTVIQRYLEKFFQPAVKNIRDNLGHSSVNEDLIKEVCRNILEEAKKMYSPSWAVPPSPRVTSTSNSNLSPNEQDSNMDDTRVSDYDNMFYPPLVKWDPKRVNKDTRFILSTNATKALGLGLSRERLDARHPELVKYIVDQDDREWLGTARVPGLIAGSPNLSVMFLEDIMQIAESDEYRNNPLCMSDLQGFCVPDFIQRKIRAYITLMRTKYLPSSTSDSPTVRNGTASAGVDGVSSSVSLPVKDSDVIEYDQYLSLSSCDDEAD